MDAAPGDVEQLLRRLPSVERLLDGEGFRALAPRVGRRQRLAAPRSALAELREAVREERVDGKSLEVALAGMEDSVETKLVRATAPSLVSLINATGIIVHTNLGRAPLSASAIAAVARIAGSYSNLEYDLEKRGRGRRAQTDGRR